MLTTKPNLPQVFVDADVLFAGSASPSEFGASLVVLRMAEITLIKAVTSQQVITETERNLSPEAAGSASRIPIVGAALPRRCI